MSVIMRNICGGESGSSSSKGFPPEQVKNTSIIQDTISSVIIKWEDPDDTSLNGSTLVAWSHTVIVKKLGSLPESVKDGEILVDNYTKNKYSIDGLKDQNVIVGNTYYYRFFTYSSNKIENNSLAYQRILFSKVPSFSDCDFDTMKYLLDNDLYKLKWKVGDTKTISLSNPYAQQLEIQIWGFGQDNLQDGNRCKITIGSKDLLNTKFAMDSTGSPQGYSNSTFRKNTVPKILNCFPEKLVNIMKAADKYSYHCATNGESYEFFDKIWVPSAEEIGINDCTDYKPLYALPDKVPYSIFTDNNSRIKKINETADIYYLRNQEVYHTYYYYLVGTDGARYFQDAGTEVERGICLGFCV